MQRTVYRYVKKIKICIQSRGSKDHATLIFLL